MDISNERGAYTMKKRGRKNRRAAVPALWGAMVVLSGCAHTAGAGGVAALSRLQTLEGAPVTIEEVAARHRVTVLVWWASTCPCVRRYEERLLTLQKNYAARGVGMYAVASNADDSPEVIRDVARERGFTLPIWRDDGAELAGHFAVTSTPTVVLLDQTAGLRYRGWLDNERLPGEKDRIAYVEQALNELLTGGDDFSARSPVYGCIITRSLFESGHCVQAPN